MKSSLTLDHSESIERQPRVATLKPLRHCMIVQNYYPFSEVRVQREAEALTEQGHEVHIVCRRFGDEPTFESNGRATIHRLSLGRKKWSRFSQLFEYLAFAFLAFLKVTRLHLSHRYDVVQAHNLPDFLVFAALVPRLTGSRVILDIHDLMPEFYCSRFKGTPQSFPVRMLRWQEWLSCRFAHRVITVTDLWKDTLISRGVPSQKCFVVMNLADPLHFQRQPDKTPALAQRQESDSDSYRLLYHGTLAHRYGVDILLRAFCEVRKRIPGATLRIHGRGDFKETARALVNELGLESSVNLTTDFLSSSELSNLIRTYDLGIVPYRRDVFTDGILPTKLLEYVALGVPAVVSKTTVVSRYFTDDMVEFFECENVADLTEHICRLYHDHDRRRSIARNSERFNAVYNWPRQRDAYVRFVEETARK
jgi:glycosyltransferase involved in cell wall biosynthesis